MRITWEMYVEYNWFVETRNDQQVPMKAFLPYPRQRIVGRRWPNLIFLA